MGCTAGLEVRVLKSLRVLIVEDAPDDADLCLRELRRSGFDSIAHVTSNEDGFRAALCESWDIVLCDYTMPSFSGTDALLILRGKEIDTPFIFVSGTIGEEAAVTAMRDGAQDYIVKNNLRRLGPAIERALAEATARRERDRAVEEMRAAEGRLARVLAMAPDAILAVDDVSRIVIFNHAAEVMFGYDAADAETLPISHIVPGLFDLAAREVPSRDALLRNPKMFRATVEALRGPERTQTAPRIEVVCRRSDGREFTAEVSVARFADAGRIRDLAVIRDVSERRALEDQLRQAQKMEAVGQLTGGVAHDFNNLLTVIQGNLDLVLYEFRPMHPEMREMIESALAASKRGADLVRHLLVFSRRQTLSPETIGVSSLVTTTIDFYRRTLGEQYQIVFGPSDGLWDVRADKVQLESALANLAINARDAMPDGGVINITTRNVTLTASEISLEASLSPGDYVEISIRDTGCGMTPEVLEKAIDPFFTTKETGKGTGLGLSMVFGFTRQSGGELKIESSAGAGTTVRMILPRAQVVDSNHVWETAGAKTPRFQTTILVVDDNVDVRRILVLALCRLGYRVIEAADGPSALVRLEAEDRVELLITDIILPNGMYGPVLAKQALLLRPGLRVLFMSGNAAVADGYLDAIRDTGNLLAKPWTAEELADTVGEALGADRGPASPAV